MPEPCQFLPFDVMNLIEHFIFGIPIWLEYQLHVNEYRHLEIELQLGIAA